MFQYCIYSVADPAATACDVEMYRCMFRCELLDLNAHVWFGMTCATRASIRMEVSKEATAAVLRGKVYFNNKATRGARLHIS